MFTWSYRSRKQVENKQTMFYKQKWIKKSAVHTRSKCLLLTTDCVLQSWPPIVKSKRNASELTTSILHVSDRPNAYIRPLNGLLVRTWTAIRVSLQCTATKREKKNNTFSKCTLFWTDKMIILVARQQHGSDWLSHISLSIYLSITFLKEYRPSYHRNCNRKGKKNKKQHD